MRLRVEQRVEVFADLGGQDHLVERDLGLDEVGPGHGAGGLLPHHQPRHPRRQLQLARQQVLSRLGAIAVDEQQPLHEQPGAGEEAGTGAQPLGGAGEAGGDHRPHVHPALEAGAGEAVVQLEDIGVDAGGQRVQQRVDVHLVEPEPLAQTLQARRLWRERHARGDLVAQAALAGGQVRGPRLVERLLGDGALQPHAQPLELRFQVGGVVGERGGRRRLLRRSINLLQCSTGHGRGRRAHLRRGARVQLCRQPTGRSRAIGRVRRDHGGYSEVFTVWSVVTDVA